MKSFTCPTCGRRINPAERGDQPPTAPFCSDRCQQIDLGRWLNGEYVISDPIDPTAADEFGEEPAAK